MEGEQANINANDMEDNHVASEIPVFNEENVVEVDSEGFIDLEDDHTTHTSNKGKMPSELTSCKHGKKLTSEAWEFFDRVVIKGVLKAKCKYCPSLLSYKGANGTSHLLKHARKVCPGKHLRLGVGQTQLKVKTEIDGSTTLELKEKEKDKKFDQDNSRKELVSMVVIHEYPLSIVDHIGFRRFVKSLNSSFKMISRNTLRSDIMRMYNEDRASLKALLAHNDGRIAITTDMWTASNQKKGYMVVTSHFIDQQWVLRNRTLR